MSRLLEGKVAVVTGAGGGIGREHALALAREGAKVVVNDLGTDRHGGGRGAEMADRVVEEIRAASGEAVPSYDTAATREGADGILWTAQSKFGGIDILVNNAGILRDRTVLNMSDEDWSLVLDVHLNGTFHCTQAAARAMKVQGRGGRIINTTSLSGLVGNFGQGNYAAAKAGIYGLTRVCALELQKLGITVNAVAPMALTRMTSDLAMFKGATEKDLGPQFVAPGSVCPLSEITASKGSHRDHQGGNRPPDAPGGQHARRRAQHQRQRGDQEPVRAHRALRVRGAGHRFSHIGLDVGSEQIEVFVQAALQRSQIRVAQRESLGPLPILGHARQLTYCHCEPVAERGQFAHDRCVPGNYILTRPKRRSLESCETLLKDALLIAQLPLDQSRLPREKHGVNRRNDCQPAHLQAVDALQLRGTISRGVDRCLDGLGIQQTCPAGDQHQQDHRGKTERRPLSNG